MLNLGRFNDASVQFTKYLVQNKQPASEFVLKSWLTNMLGEKFGDTKRNPLQSKYMTELALLKKDKKDLKKSFWEALKIDPLNGLAWFNYAVCCSDIGESERSLHWLATATIQSWDVEAWGNALVSLFSDKDQTTKCPVLFAAGVFESFSLHGSLMSQQLEKILSNQPQTKSKATTDKIVVSIEKMIVQLQDTFTQLSSPMVIRVHSGSLNIGKLNAQKEEITLG
ncbi:MAG: hypothetical protein HY606_01865 [Planctomycetes bacterium]|nr:hypothetical protein [Planctomycetota bacterium]